MNQNKISGTKSNSLIHLKYQIFYKIVNRFLIVINRFNVQIYIEAFRCNNEEISDFIQTLEANIYEFTTDYIKKLFRDINTNLVRRFNKLFKKDE